LNDKNSFWQTQKGRLWILPLPLSENFASLREQFMNKNTAQFDSKNLDTPGSPFGSFLLEHPQCWLGPKPGQNG
jgi:hypothetical protein